MKFTAKPLEDNVNVSKTHPLVELFWLLGGLIFLAGVVFFALGLTADWAASKAPVKVENWLGELALNEFPGEESPALTARLNNLLDHLPDNSPLHQYDFHIFLSEIDEVNALALPGGNIVVFSGLIEQVKSENELAMVLAHELGHFAHRDHLSGLGRGLGVAVAASLLFGENNAAGNLISKAFLTFQVKYSQNQETAADRFGIDLLAKRYGHAGGATSFFARLAQDAGSKIPYILASHPHPLDRIDAMNNRIRKQGYAVMDTEALRTDLRISQ